MTEKPIKSHADYARDHLAKSGYVDALTVNAVRAQAHATLALVEATERLAEATERLAEAQETANLIAYISSLDAAVRDYEKRPGGGDFTSSHQLVSEQSAEIRRRLGIPFVGGL